MTAEGIPIKKGPGKKPPHPFPQSQQPNPAAVDDVVPQAKAAPPMITVPRQPKDFRASELTQAQHDTKADAVALAYKEQNIANMARAFEAHLIGGN